jgi:hypothetical protein
MRRIHKAIHRCCWHVGRGNLQIAEMLVGPALALQTIEATLLYWPRLGRANWNSLRCSSARMRMLRRSGWMVQDYPWPSSCSRQSCSIRLSPVGPQHWNTFLDPDRIEGWLRTGASPLGLAGQVGALIASCALESSTRNRLEDVRAFLFHNLDMLQDPSKWP